MKISLKAPDFRHKHSGHVDGLCNPLSIKEKLERVEIPHIDAKTGRAAIIGWIRSCGKKKDITSMRRLHNDNVWINQDIRIANTLIRSYAKSGALSEAQELFDQLDKPDVVSWSALISGYADQGYGDKALKCVRQMEMDRVIPDPVTYAIILKACSIAGDLQIVRKIHAWVSDQGLLSRDIILGTSLVNAYAKCDAVKEAQEVFDQLPERNVVCWGAVISAYAEQGSGEVALTCFRQMQNDGVIPDTVAYVCSLKACAIVGALTTVKEMHSQVIQQGLLNKDIVLRTTLVYTYAKCGAVKESQKVFDQFEQHDVVSWSALIAGYADQGLGEEALTCFRQMQINGMTPNSWTYATILKACAIVGALEIVEEIHAHVIEQEVLQNNTIVGASLINSYAKCGSVDEAWEIFDKLVERDVDSWNALITGYVDQGFGEEALACFKEMKRERVIPNSVTYTCILKASGTVGALQVVEEIHAKMREQYLLGKDVVLGTTLVNAYAKCGALKEAWEVFDQLLEQDVESWSALLACYAQLGDVNEMLELFNRMMARAIFPNHVTFLVLLNGCSHGALLEEGQLLFDLIRTFGLTPNIEHHTCMVDLLGRAGQFEKARSFVLEHTSTLLALLGACQKYVNVDLGRWAFNKLLQLDKKCASAYVCMANIYATAGMLKEAYEIECMGMKQPWSLVMD